MYEYYCFECETEFDLETHLWDVRCPDCLGWDTICTEDEDQDGDVYAAAL